MSTSRSKVKNAFTLIELLVVISIVTLLLAVLLPALGKARESARSVKCLVHIRQFMVLHSTYQNEFRDYYVPSFISKWNGTTNTATWAGIFRMLDYVNNTSFMICPSDDTNDKREEIKNASTASSPTWSGWLYVDYGYNDTYIGSHRYSYSDSGTFSQNTTAVPFGASFDLMPNGGPVKFGEVIKPSQTILKAESFNTNAPHRGYFTVSSQWTTSNYFGVVATRHSSSASILWADGHVTSSKGTGHMIAGAAAVTWPNPYLVTPFSNGPDGFFWNRSSY